MNLAARLESICDPIQILLSEDTHALISSEFRFADIGEHEIRGFGTKRIFRLEGSLESANDRDRGAI